MSFTFSPLLLFKKLFLIAFKPTRQIDRRLFQLIVVQQAAAQRFKKSARAHVVSELLVSFVRRSLWQRDEKFFIERSQAALHPAQREAAFARDGPVRQTEGEIVERLGFELSQQRPL